jgi:shikimate dehydrogenase
MKLGVIGFPLDHSLSAPMQSAALEAVGLNWTYRNLHTRPGDLGDRVQSLRAPDWRGANVTLPHKQAVLPLLDRLDAGAQAVGAVNCITNQGGQLVGSNTDVPALEMEFARLGGDWGGRAVWILGAGGAARACAFALAHQKVEVSIVCRQPSQGKQLAAALARRGEAHARVLPWSSETLASAPEAALIVNATPVGMWPNHDGCPWPEPVPLPAESIVFDLVYNPAVTRLVARARAAGLHADGGAGMLIEQGAQAFERWTCSPAPRHVMRHALLGALETENAQIPNSG